jgi:outer membrane protein TolC
MGAKMKKIFLSAVILMAAALPAGAAVVTEKQVIDSALGNNPGLIAAEKTARSYEAKSHKQFFLENPTVGFDFMGVSSSGVSLGEPAQNFLMVTENIPFPLKYIWKAGGAVAEADQYRQMYEMKRFETINETRAAYYELYRTGKNIEITKEAAGLLKQISGIAFVKYNQGVVPQQDVLKADLENDILANDLIGLDRQRETDIQALRSTVGDENFLKDGDFSLEDPVQPELKYGFDEVREMVLGGAPVIKIAEAERILSDNMRSMAIADYIPDLNVQFKKSIVPGSQDYELIIQADIPLFFLNNQQADIGEKWEMASAKQDDLLEAQNRAVLEAKEHFETIKADARSIGLYKSNLIPQAEAGLKSAITSYQAKKMEFMALLDSERMLLDLKKDYYMRLTEYLLHFRMLEELAGRSLEQEQKLTESR